MSAKNKFGVSLALSVTVISVLIVVVISQMEQAGTIPIEHYETLRLLAGYSGTCAGAAFAPLALWFGLYIFNHHPHLHDEENWI